MIAEQAPLARVRCQAGLDRQAHGRGPLVDGVTSRPTESGMSRSRRCGRRSDSGDFIHPHLTPKLLPSGGAAATQTRPLPAQPHFHAMPSTACKRDALRGVLLELGSTRQALGQQASGRRPRNLLGLLARNRRRVGNAAAAAPRPLQSQAHAVEVKIDHGRRIERQQLADQQPADDGDSERLAQLAAVAHAVIARQYYDGMRPAQPDFYVSGRTFAPALRRH
jgi:hypothetical protein